MDTSRSQLVARRLPIVTITAKRTEQSAKRHRNLVGMGGQIADPKPLHQRIDAL